MDHIHGMAREEEMDSDRYIEFLERIIDEFEREIEEICWPDEETDE